LHVGSVRLQIATLILTKDSNTQVSPFRGEPRPMCNYTSNKMLTRGQSGHMSVSVQWQPIPFTMAQPGSSCRERYGEGCLPHGEGV